MTTPATPLEGLLSSLSAAPDQSLKFDARLDDDGRIDPGTRARMWQTVASVLDRHPPTTGSVTGLLLGRIQSGKTTAMTSLATLASDRGYRIVVAVLGTTNLLLDQNTSRLLEGLGIRGGLTSDYVWTHLDAASEGNRLGREVALNLQSGRTVLITVLKHSRRLDQLARQLEQVDLSGVRALVLDDEADQASLNTQVREGLESPTYRAIGNLMASLGDYIFVQVTATPFAPLLLEAGDALSPSFVEVLEPGPGYTGAKEFFVDAADTVVRLVGASEALRAPPAQLPAGLRNALASFLLGAAILLHENADNAPVSMLVHPTHRTNVHERVALLLRREIQTLRDVFDSAEAPDALPEPFPSQLADLRSFGVGAIPDDALLDRLRHTARLLRIWVVNSQSEQDNVRWVESPAHILVGGNKLDRGFTIEGLTVSYLSRSTSTQADTLAQRARAFGYRHEYLPYCRFFGTALTVDGFRSSVQTEEAMRRELLDWVAEGHSLSDWSERVGFLMGDGMRPTRIQVAPSIVRTPARGWHILSCPSTDDRALAHNRSLLEGLGLFEAEQRDYGRLTFRTVPEISIESIAAMVRSWAMPARSGWSRTDICSFLERVAKTQPDISADVVLMNAPDGSPRRRRWRDKLGFSNLMQGRDNNYSGAAADYPGDRAMFNSSTGLQVHWVVGREGFPPPVHTLAIHIGDEVLAATEVRRS